MRKFFAAAFFLLILAPALTAADIIPGDRLIDWSASGIPGGIPNRTAVCANVKNAPYNAYGDGVHDDTVAIQFAINNCTVGQVVYLPEGKYRVSTHNLSGYLRNLYISKGITLRGDGPGKTVLLAASSRLFNMGGGDPTNYVDVVSGYQKGSTSITLASTTFTSVHASPTTLSVGNYLIIDQENDNTTTVVTSTGSGGTCTWCGLSRCSSNHNIVDSWGEGGACDGGLGVYQGGRRSLGQIVKVTGMNGNTITFEPALYWNYVASAEPKATKLNGMVEYAGIEDLTVNDTYGKSRHTIDMDQCAYCWFRNVELANTSRYGIVTLFSYRNEFRDNYFHHSYCYPGDHGYGISFSQHSTANLVENNIFDNLHVPIAREGGGGGNVYGYNYFDHGRYNTDCTANTLEHVAMPDAIVPHGAHPVFDLIEGNIGYKFGGDYYWGTSSHTTTFRNRVIGYDPTYYENMAYSGYHYRMEAVVALPLARYQRYMSFVGNVLGTPNVSTTYEMEETTLSLCWTYTAHYKYIYHLGYVSPWNCSGDYRDLLVKETLIRHGNFDYVTNSTIWDSNIPDHSIPASMYLSSKPSWFGSLPWPAIGPDANPMNGTIPAKLRFEAMMAGGVIPNCTEADWTYADGACQPDNTSVRTWTKISSCENGVQHNATETIACVYSNISMEGDLDGDGDVDIDDLVLIGAHFGQTSAHQEWNATADAVSSGEIDIYDIVFVASRFGS